MEGTQLGLEEAEWRAFCARLERVLAPAAEETEAIRIHIDGAARGNPGPAAYGVILTDSAGLTLHEEGNRIGQTTNNVAEYRALIRALEIAQTLDARSLQIRSDSELLVRQMNGLYRVKHEQLLPLYLQARELCRHFTTVEILHVPRNQNRRADHLANLALDTPESGQ